VELSGAEIVVQSLVDEGVEFVFGYPGGATLYIYDAIFKHDGINHILTRHEQGAAHAADGYTRSTGKTGVVLVTSGPGATNVVTGIATAHMDSIPMVILTGQVMTQLIGNDAFQEADIVGITRPCVKHNVLVKDVTAETALILFKANRTNRRGHIVGSFVADWWNIKSMGVSEEQKWPSYLDCHYGNYSEDIAKWPGYKNETTIPPRKPIGKAGPWFDNQIMCNLTVSQY